MKRHTPPKWADKFLEWYCRPELLEEIQGDAYELFDRAVLRHRHVKARMLFVWNVLRFLRWKNIRRFKTNHYSSSQLSSSMLQNYFKTGWRNLVQKKAFSFINIFGLAIGLTAFLLIGSYVYDELQFDRYPLAYKNIHRVGLQLQQNGTIADYPSVDVAVGAGIKNEFPEVTAFTRLTGIIEDYLKFGDQTLKEKSMVLADSNFLQFFSIQLMEGNADKALTEPNSIVVSRAFEKKMFGDKSALGQTLTSRRFGELKVTGVFDRIPDRSHFHYEVFLSMMTQQRIVSGRQTWSNLGFFTYLMLHEQADPGVLEEKFRTLVDKHVVEEVRDDMGISLTDAQKTVDNWKFYLMPLSKIHLYSHTKYEMEANGDINTVYIFTALGAFILLLACINFMNLSTAGSARRAREIGVRKSMGAFSGQLMTQFLVETMGISLIALAVAVALSVAMLPAFNHLTGKHIMASFFLSPPIAFGLLTLGLIVGILAGIYPAVFLSSFNTLRVLKGNASVDGKRSNLRNALVVFQFAVSTALIIATVVAYRQLHYLQNINVGYDREQIVVLENVGALQHDVAPFKRKLTEDHRIRQVSRSTVPIGSADTYAGTEVSSKGPDAVGTHMHLFFVDDTFLETMGLSILHGRYFSSGLPGDSLGQNVIINETAMKTFGWNEENVIGNTIIRSGQVEYQVIGVVKDFHYTAATEKIAPMMMIYGSVAPTFIVKATTDDMASLIADLKGQWNSFHTDLPFTYYFLDERFSHLYHSEQITEQVFVVFMIIAILIASLGLYGLSMHSAEQRVKEIGIRKVLGSSVGQIILMQSKDFVILVLVAIAIASPLTWWAMQQWLENFGYRISMDFSVILISGAAAIFIAVITVSFQAIRAATANPVESLRSE